PTSASAVTYRMVLAHASSIEDSDIADMFYEYGSDPTISLLDAVSGYLDPNGAYHTNDNWSAADPGTAASYSNMGYAFAGLLTQLHTGIDFADHTEATILAPLGMDDSAWRLSDHDLDTIAMAYAWEGGRYQEYGHYTFADYPNGGLRGSACDVARFLGSQASGGEPILAPATLAAMQEIAYPGLDDVQGLGWYFEDIGPGDWIGHSGGEQGIFTEAFYRTSDGVGFVLLTNAAGDDENLLFDLEGSIIEWADAL
ncbi:MAG: beta-lactamase family protein, partial [Deltaproteobacteria bacterium]|nr:beta-lactamase family protein [Deltaproteobacteria bacterium]